MTKAALLVLFSLSVVAEAVGIPANATRYRSILTREAKQIYGINAPVPMLAAQIEQESSWRVDVTAWDNGRGLAQFMDGTTKDITRLFPELGKPSPYDPLWSIRAIVRYDRFIKQRVTGDTECDDWGATLKGYNAGYGYVLDAQRRSPKPGVWFGATEHVKTKQSAANFEHSRLYPRKILFDRQRKYRDWGVPVCLED